MFIASIAVDLEQLRPAFKLEIVTRPSSSGNTPLAMSSNIWASHTLVDLGMVETVDMKSALIIMFLQRLNRKGDHLHTETLGR